MLRQQKRRYRPPSVAAGNGAVQRGKAGRRARRGRYPIPGRGRGAPEQPVSRASKAAGVEQGLRERYGPPGRRPGTERRDTGGEAMTGRSTMRLTLGILLGVVGGVCWLWWVLAYFYQAGPVLLPFLLGLVLMIVAGVLIWTSPERPAAE